MRYPTTLSLVVVALSASAVAGAGDIYCNNQGRDCSDRPSPNATVVHVSSPPSANSESAPAPDPGAKAPVDAGADSRLKDNATRQAVQKDVSTNRAEQCTQAKDKYQKSIEARRIYRVNKAGEREYLSDAELDQARLNARLEMDRACGNPGS